MAGKTDYTENNLLNFIFRGTAFPVPAGLFIALFTTTPSADAGTGGVEATGGSYARQAVARNTTEWKDPATAVQGLTENVNTITFPTASGSWGTIAGAAVMDAASGGNMLYFGPLTVAKPVGVGDVFKFNSGDLEITED